MFETLAEQLRQALLAGKRTKVRRREIEIVSDLVDLPGGQQIELVSTRKKDPQAGEKTLELRRAVAF
ncbi:hypothetical protein FDV58_27495 [Bradyrhizobium elkanii]|uniref:Uncharacterized protein n=1 Tax=Bradyrhizobium elkanii TaxID=29448 RepID=A0A4U6RXB8_BRAEL|nr:hypothetical protein [Bradyrhizobium sp. BR2003]TKV78282.1 hypothetical protein FDV58_27495 [Bradyrhizobium elkanii]